MGVKGLGISLTTTVYQKTDKYMDLKVSHMQVPTFKQILMGK